MIYKNSLKIMMNNFFLVSRIFVLMVLQAGMLFGLSYVFLLPVIRLLEQQGFFATLQGYYEQFLQTLNFQLAFEHIGEMLEQFYTLVMNNFSSVGWWLIALVVLYILLNAFLSNFYELVVSNSLYQSMSNNIRYGFGPSLVSTLTQNIRYSLLSLVVKLPLGLISLFVIAMSFKLLFVGGIVSFFAPLFILLIAFTVLSVQKTLLYGWAPALLSFNKGVFASWWESLKVTKFKLKKSFANGFYVLLTVFVVNVFAGLVTFGAALIITLPMSVLLIQALGMVLFYSNYGMRYYVDPYNVIVPNTREQTQPLCNMKYIV